MTGKQNAVLWLGILLIAAQFYFGGQFKALFGLVKPVGPAPSKSPKRPGTDPNSASNPSGVVAGGHGR